MRALDPLSFSVLPEKKKGPGIISSLPDPREFDSKFIPAQPAWGQALQIQCAIKTDHMFSNLSVASVSSSFLIFSPLLLWQNKL